MDATTAARSKVECLLSFGCDRDGLTPLSVIIKIYGNMRQRYDTKAHKNEDKPIKKVWFQLRRQ